jgi:hypothetical protein
MHELGATKAIILYYYFCSHRAHFGSGFDCDTANFGRGTSGCGTSLQKTH